jgi:predicted HTH transcriptional regulator
MINPFLYVTGAARNRASLARPRDLRQIKRRAWLVYVPNSVLPAAVVTLRSVSVLGTEVLVIVVPPWNRRDVYQFDDKIHIRKGTNVFTAKPEELKKLHRGEYVV